MCLLNGRISADVRIGFHRITFFEGDSIWNG